MCPRGRGQVDYSLLRLGTPFAVPALHCSSLFFLAFVGFILIYLLLLIRDLDNPFSCCKKESLTEEVSLYPIEYVRTRIEAAAKDLR
jgi:hypothetical protein